MERRFIKGGIVQEILRLYNCLFFVWLRNCMSFLIALAALYFPLSLVAQRDSITTAIAPEYDSVSHLHRALFGENYRKLWAQPVKLRVLFISKEKGGLTPFDKGGGGQTKSLKLKDANGGQWVLRSVQKYSEQHLPEHLKKTIVKSILQDLVSTNHPYASLTVPVFADALGVLHTHPEIVYAADDAALDKYQNEFANTVVLLEEYPGSEDKTEEAQDNVEHDNRYLIDQQAVLRARLLDHLLGDWDRHEGQWRWKRNIAGGDTVYTPFPRDRDKVFYTTSGLLPRFVSRQRTQKIMQGFRNQIKSIAYYNSYNRHFDRYFLNSLSMQDWDEAFSFLQQRITDSVINAALYRLPSDIYSLCGGEIAQKLMARRSSLKKDVLKYYRFLSKKVDVPASDNDELFDIVFDSSKNVLVQLYRLHNGNKGKLLFSRRFEHDVTSEIRLYGMGGNDVFKISGEGKPSIRLRMIGGTGNDSFFIAPQINSRRRLYIYDKKDESNVLPPPAKARLKLSNDTLVNTFNRLSFKYEKMGPFFALQYDNDLGLLLTAGTTYEKQGFRKEPFAEQHVLAAQYATETASWFFNYSAYLTKVIGNSDVSISVLSRGLHSVGNFFGIGNETSFVKTITNKPLNYYRNRYDYVQADVRLHSNLSKRVSISAGIASLFYTSSPSANTNRFFNTFADMHPEQDIYTNRLHAGIVSGIEINTRNSNKLPHKGILWRTGFSAMKEFIRHHSSFGKALSELTFYVPVVDSGVVIANRTGFGTTVGNPVFFQQMQLGGLNLRGFYTNRFTGKSMMYNNLDLRVKLFQFVSYLLPGTIGLVAFNDVGRVWAPGEASNKWHHGYGGGVYIIPGELVLIQAIASFSAEGILPFVSVGFTF